MPADQFPEIDAAVTPETFVPKGSAPSAVRIPAAKPHVPAEYQAAYVDCVPCTSVTSYVNLKFVMIPV